MSSSSLHALHSRIFPASLCCLLAVGFCGLSQGGHPGMAQTLAHAMQPVPEINVRAKVVVGDKRLKLLDFCEPDTLPEEWKGLLSGVDLGLAPKAGREADFNPQQLAHHLQRLLAAQGMDPKQTKVQLPDRITVVRQQIPITREQIEAIYREFVLKKASWKTEDLDIRQIAFSDIPALPSGVLNYEVTASPHETFVGDVSVTIHFFVDSKEVRNMRVAGKVDLYQEVAHSVRSIKRSEVISDADIQFQRINIAARPDRYVLQREHIVGKKLLSEVGPNQPIRPRDLDKPSLVKRGDPVTIVFQEDGIRLCTRGEAKENGGEGDRIRILNVDTKKSIFCQVIDAQTVGVLP
jgi:flagellar basal body P-ring formation protein FlgA